MGVLPGQKKLVVITRCFYKKMYGRFAGSKKKLVVITRCFYKKMYGRFVGSKKTGRNNEVFL